ncbi:hypothetical protein Pelo_17213 [Pelomyxa schiedti]|nr:hypothetical protein Pelo_17213 [Pelomyxa schiedti]
MVPQKSKVRVGVLIAGKGTTNKRPLVKFAAIPREVRPSWRAPCRFHEREVRRRFDINSTESATIIEIKDCAWFLPRKSDPLRSFQELDCVNLNLDFQESLASMSSAAGIPKDEVQAQGIIYPIAMACPNTGTCEQFLKEAYASRKSWLNSQAFQKCRH